METFVHFLKLHLWEDSLRDDLETCLVLLQTPECQTSSKASLIIVMLTVSPIAKHVVKAARVFQRFP